MVRPPIFRTRSAIASRRSDRLAEHDRLPGAAPFAARRVAFDAGSDGTQIYYNDWGALAINIREETLGAAFSVRDCNRFTSASERSCTGYERRSAHLALE